MDDTREMKAQELAGRLTGKRFGVVGVGNALRGDDGAGPALVARLAAGRARFPAVDASEVPENYAGWIVNEGLDAVIFADAVEFGGAPGDWRIIPIDDLMHSASSTHRLSLHFLIRYLKEEWRGEALLIGVQPKSMKLGEDLSPEVATGVEGLAAALLAAQSSS
jgi:hydrogenase maturation protease